MYSCNHITSYSNAPVSGDGKRLGRPELDRAAWRCGLASREHRGAEIRELRLAPKQENVLRLHVAVVDPVRVAVAQRVDDAREDADGVVLAQRPVRINVRVQITVCELHGKVQRIRA